MRLHHVGIVVRDLREYSASCVAFLGLHPATEVFHDPIQKVRVQFWRDDTGHLLELVEPAAPDSPVNEALRKGGGLNHLCFEVDDIETDLRAALDRGALPVTGIAPAVAFEGRRIAFLFLPDLNLVEFVEAARE
jgi:methylmalonyl-CoA/ethylmalonyl-CoA epimerase